MVRFNPYRSASSKRLLNNPVSYTSSAPARSTPQTILPFSPSSIQSAAIFRVSILALYVLSSMPLIQQSRRPIFIPGYAAIPRLTPAATASVTSIWLNPRSVESCGAKRISAYPTPSPARSSVNSNATRSSAAPVWRYFRGSAKRDRYSDRLLHGTGACIKVPSPAKSAAGCCPSCMAANSHIVFGLNEPSRCT